jgi:DNA polymerase-3 subunit alpha
MRVKQSTWRSTNSPIFLRKECTEAAPSGDFQKSGNELIMKIARAHNIPILLTLDAHFVNKDQKMVQDLLLQNGRDEDSGLRFSTKYYQMNSDQAWEKWITLHGTNFASHFQEGVESNHAIADMCEQIHLEKKYHLPEVSFPKEIVDISSSHEDKLKNLIYCLIDSNGRMNETEEYRNRLNKEIQVISDNGKINLLPYFLSLYEICEQARQLGIWIGAGRGSAGGCLLAYLLKITHIDPVKYNLSFERFLSSGRINRGKLPDIDIDFSEPDKIAEALKSKHGDKFVRICTTGTNKVKSAIRDVSRVILDTKFNENNKLMVDKVCKTINNVPQGFSDLLKWLHGWDDEEGHHAGELEINKTLYNFFDEHPSVQSLVEQIIGIPKSLGRHASAYCLSDVPINEIVPVCRIGEEECTQFTMEAVESMGLIKFDLLGLNTLKDIGNCVQLIKERHSKEIDIYNIPEESIVFKEFCKGKTETIFQFNGPIPTKVCRQIKPKSIIDLAAITAACRPGTMYALMYDEQDDETTTLIDLWVKRRQGKKEVSYLHEDLKDILSNTHGIVLFQEQISAMFQKSCQYSPEQADEIREIIGKKKLDKMNEILPDIRKRLQDRGWDATQVSAFVSLCRSSSNYAFNLSHSVAYSYMAYVCMWLKSHYPLEWWTAILQNSNHEDLAENAKYFSEIVKLPDVNISQVDFYIIDDSDKKIVYPLTMVKGVKNASQEVFEKAPYSSLKDFFDKIDKKIVNKRVVSALIFAGALDKLATIKSKDKTETRNNLIHEYNLLRGEKTSKLLSKGEIDILESKSLCIGSPDVVDYFLSKGMHSCIGIPEVMLTHEGYTIKTAGIILAIKKIKTKKGQDMCFIDIGNKEFQISVTCFPERYEQIKDDINVDKVVLVTGKINVYNDRKSIVADSIKVFNIDEIN